jgi:hypothetical protein
MNNKFETNSGQEYLEKMSEVKLHFFRHGEAERDPNKTNQAFDLSGEGRKQGMEKSNMIGGERNLDQSVAFGSPRKRAQQTAGLAMAGGFFDSVTGNESLEELQEKIDKDIKVGSKIGIDSRLDFHLDKNTPFGREAYEAVFTNHDYLKFLVNRSDQLAIETNDEKASTYSRHARDMAEIVEKYVKVGKQWNKLVASGKYADNKLERFLGTHGGVAESFLLKVIEKTKGIEERNKLLELMPHQFDYAEGLDITLVDKGSDQLIRVSFKKEDKNDSKKNFIFDEEVPLKIIEDIAKE